MEIIGGGVNTMNKIKSTQLIAIVGILALGILASSCGKKNLVDPNQTGEIAIAITWPNGSKAMPLSQSNSLKLSKPQVAPPEVRYIDITLSAADFATRNWRFNASDGNAFISNIPEGGGRTLRISARDTNENECYWYQDTNVIIAANQTTEVYPTLVQNQPFPPSNLTATWMAPEIRLSWTDNAFNENSYEIERKEGSTNWVTMYTVASNSTSYGDISFTWGASYAYRVKATNSGGSSSYSNEAAVTFDNSYLTPPSNVLAFWNSSNEIAVTWTDNTSVETNFIIERAHTLGDWVNYGTVSANTTLFLDTNFNMGDIFYYRVRAADAYTQSEPSSDSYFNTANLPPQAPLIKYCINDGTALKIAWSRVQEADSYLIHRSGGLSPEWTSIGTTTVPDTTYLDYGVSDQYWYRYAIKSSNEFGFSDMSAPDSAYFDNSGPLYFKRIFRPENGDYSLYKMAISGRRLYITNGMYLRLYDITVPVAPTLLNSYQVSGSVIRGIYVTDYANNLVLLTTDTHIIALEITPGGVINFYSQLALDGPCRCIAVNGNTAFVGSDSYGIHAIDIYDPFDMTYLADFNNGLVYNDLKMKFISDSVYVLAATPSNGLAIINVTTPTTMHQTGNYVLGGQARGLDLKNNLAFIANGNLGLQVVDFSNLWSMSFWGGYSGAYDVTSVKVYGNHALVAGGSEGFFLINSTSLALVESFGTGADCVDVAYDPLGGYAFATAPGIGLFIFALAP